MKVSKESVHYREATGSHHCGNCSMFRPREEGEAMCTLVQGMIERDDVCDRWDPVADKQMLTVELAKMLARYHDILDERDRLALAGVSEARQGELEASAWAVRRQAYKVLVALADNDDVLVLDKAAQFGWSADQLCSEHLRSWLCGEAG